MDLVGVSYSGGVRYRLEPSGAINRLAWLVGGMAVSGPTVRNGLDGSRTC